MLISPQSAPPFSFHDYQRTIVARYRKILEEASLKGEASIFDEQALPAYTNPNLLIRWVFWQRIRNVIDYLLKRIEDSSGAEASGPLGTVLDFGCGLGTMLQFLNERAAQVIGADVNIREVLDIARANSWTKVKFCSSFAGIEKEMTKRFDIIIALDVLEHIEDLDSTLAWFKNNIDDDGVLIICGPTENLAYKLGRKIAGYSGHYHCRDVYGVESFAKKHFEIEKIRTLFPVLPLFEIFSARTL